MEKEKIKRLIIIGWIFVILLGIGIFIFTRPRILKDDSVDANPYLIDDTDYNLDLNTQFEVGTSPLYICKTTSIPVYLDNLANDIDPTLERNEDVNFVRWVKDENIVLTYDIDSMILNINLSNYPEVIKFTSVERFVINSLDSSIQYGDITQTDNGGISMYRANREVNNEEIKTGYGYSDYYLVKNGYLSTARIMLANIDKTNLVAPLIDQEALKTYLSNPSYPKNITLDTTDVIVVDEQSYETSNPEFDYDSCSINELKPVIYFTDCTSNYISYSYEISGVCDIEYDNLLYSVPFLGFINAIDPQYVKSIQ